jgi:2-oxoglutaroyl-CoA hydrolase
LAKQALEWGIATECVPDAELEKATNSLVDELRTFARSHSEQRRSF